jgi:threonine dehydrogenase-like Zn-dependent dehydrogenase
MFAYLWQIPEGVSLEEGVMLGDIISTGFFCAYQADIKPKNVYAVVGCGPVGLMTILGAREYGTERVFAIDTVEDRLKHAERFGATPINSLHQNPTEVIRQFTQGRGADGVMEAVGNHGAGKLAYELVRPGGIISHRCQSSIFTCSGI